MTFVLTGQDPPPPPVQVTRDNFDWVTNGNVLRTDPQPGSFQYLPETEDHGLLTIGFKNELPVALPAVDDESIIGQRYVFDGWERNSLSNWLQGQDHQWLGASNEKCTFDRESFTGVIAYYRLVQTRIPKAHGKTYKWGPIDKGCPFNNIGIFEAGGRFFFNLKELSEGKIIARSDSGSRPVQRKVGRSLAARIQSAASRLRSDTDNRSFDMNAEALSRLLTDTNSR